MPVLLDNFFRSSQQVREEEASYQTSGQAYILDPVLKYLAKNFISASDLDLKLLGMFRAFDVHRRGKLSFQDVALGVHRANPTSSDDSHLTEDDFFEMTDNLKMCESDGSLDLKSFKTVMLKKLRAYLQRRSAEAALFMQAPAEVEALLLNTKFLMVETHLMTEALIKEEARKEGLPQHAHPAEMSHAAFCSGSFKNGGIFSSEKSLVESRDKCLPRALDISTNLISLSPVHGTTSQSLGAAKADAKAEDLTEGFDAAPPQLDTGHRATHCTCSSAVRPCAPFPSRRHLRASFGIYC